jgi:hypothetical protein
MIDELNSTGLQNPPPSFGAAAMKGYRRDISPRPWGVVASRGRRSDRTIGFWLGAIVLGIAGCIFGGSMPYHHPVGIAISILWWGLFYGCFGACIGALAGLWTEQIPAPLLIASPIKTFEDVEAWALPGVAALVAAATHRRKDLLEVAGTVSAQPA